MNVLGLELEAALLDGKVIIKMWGECVKGEVVEANFMISVPVKPMSTNDWKN